MEQEGISRGEMARWAIGALIGLCLVLFVPEHLEMWVMGGMLLIPVGVIAYSMISMWISWQRDPVLRAIRAVEDEKAKRELRPLRTRLFLVGIFIVPMALITIVKISPSERGMFLLSLAIGGILAFLLLTFWVRPPRKAPEELLKEALEKREA